MNILFSCIGRRVSLLKSFREAARALEFDQCIIGTEVTELSAALQLCDRRYIVEPVDHAAYLGQLLEVAEKDEVDLLVPTTDLDLKVLAANRPEFEKLGCCVLVSRLEVVEICQDKRKTFGFLTDNGFGTPETLSLSEAISRERLGFPLFLKPWDGSAGRGTARVSHRRELEVLAERIPNCIVQEFVEGVEYTCDVFVDAEMKVRTVVPRKRIEIRSGEVSKGEVVRHERIMSRTAALVEVLGAGPGVITIQLIEDSGGDLKFIEINPRFGGGVPLSIKAGADFPKWILQQLAGKQPSIEFGGFKDGLTMLRYDDEVWFGGAG